MPANEGAELLVFAFDAHGSLAELQDVCLRHGSGAHQRALVDDQLAILHFSLDTLSGTSRSGLRARQVKPRGARWQCAFRG